MGANAELAPLQSLPGCGAWPLLPEIRWKAGPFLEAQEGVPSPQSSLSFLPWVALARSRRQESNAALPQLSSLLPTEHFPGATAEGSPSALLSAPSLPSPAGELAPEGNPQSLERFL